MRRSVVIGGAVAAAVVAGAAAVGIAGTAGDDNDVPITGDDLTRATAAALEATGGGTVTETEVGDEEGAFEVEVTLEDGSQVDVHLDTEFRVLSIEGDDDSGADDDDDGDGNGND